jgi:predicted RND superfamily exporter protein
MRRVLEFPIRRPAWVILVALLTTAFFATRIVEPTTGELKLRIDPSFDAILPDDAPARVYYDWVKEEFGDDQSLIISLVLDDVFTLDNLHMIQRISDLLEEAEGVDYVTSLATADHIGSEDESVATRPFLEPAPETEADAERVRARVHGNPVYAGNLVSPDSRATAFIVYVDDTPEQIFTDRNLDLRMFEIVDDASGDAEVFISGTAHMRAATSRVMRADLSFMLPAVALLMALIAFVSFRSPRGVAIPLLTIVVATLWTLGLMAWADVPINLVTTITPVLLLTVGFAYSVHMVADYYEALSHDPVAVEAEGGPVSWALHHVSLPVLLTCLTTIVGFLSLTISRFPAVREFGLVSVFGVSATTLLTLTLSPAILQLLGLPRRKQNEVAQTATIPSPAWFATWVSKVGSFCIEHRRQFLIAAGVVSGLTIWGVYQIKIDTHLITIFSTDHPVRIHFEAINDTLEGARPFSVVLQSEQSEAFLDPENLRALDELTAWLEAQPEIGGATSFADYVKLLNRAFNEDDPQFLRIPDDANLIKQYLLFGETDELEDYVASGYENALIRVRSKCETTHEIAGLVERIEARMTELPEHIEAGVTGNTVVLAQSIDAIANGQIESLSIAAVFIYIMLAILFASVRMGFFGLMPNILPVLLFFGLLGLTGVPLNATTGLIACVVLGIAVDDTIHFMTRFNIEARERADEKQGALAALNSVARPVTITTVGLCLGFLVFTTGELRNQTEFGALAALVLAFAWAVDMTFTPALCSGLHIVTLWDALTYDLGENPQESIPIFAGLTKAQARITALVTRVVKHPAGTPVFRAGDVGDALCVVIEGELRVLLKTTDGRSVELARAHRGDVVGEVGLYHGKRTADVEALTDVRLLRLDANNLERLRRRYPRIGAQVLWNLSGVMANRLASATDRENVLTVRLNELSKDPPAKS